MLSQKKQQLHHLLPQLFHKRTMSYPHQLPLHTYIFYFQHSCNTYDTMLGGQQGNNGTRPNSRPQKEKKEKINKRINTKINQTKLTIEQYLLWTLFCLILCLQEAIS